MDKKEYIQKLKDPRWQKKRLKILERDKWTCQRCFDDKATLHVHHLSYQNGKEPWEYEDNCLITLCEECHEYEKEMFDIYWKSFRDIFKEKGFFADDITPIARGLFHLKCKYPNEVIASIIEFVLSDKIIFDYCIKKYFEYLEKKNKNRDGKR